LNIKKDLISFVNSGINHGHFQLPKAFTGWRKALLEDSFLSIGKDWEAHSTPQTPLEE